MWINPSDAWNFCAGQAAEVVCAVLQPDQEEYLLVAIYLNPRIRHTTIAASSFNCVNLKTNQILKSLYRVVGSQGLVHVQHPGQCSL